jgi:eukaryotic-like serine/threonine-protein kinase
MRSDSSPSTQSDNMTWLLWIMASVAILVCLCMIGVLVMIFQSSQLLSSREISPTNASCIALPLDPAIGSAWERPSDGMVMVYVPEGEFTMGSDGFFISGSIYINNIPKHPVYLNAYWIDQTEVTNGMYALCVSDGVCDTPRFVSSYTRDYYFVTIVDSGYPNYPVIWVSWNDASDYCQWAGARLPTEAEWEKAARGLDGRYYPWGNTAPACTLLNYWGKDDGCVGDTSPVGSYPEGASPYGALDLAGNVWEWVADWFGEYPDSLVRNPTGPSSGGLRVIRGGSWDNFDDLQHSSYRGTSVPSTREYYIGFRCVLSP